MPYQPAVLNSARLNNFRLNYLSVVLKTVRAARVRFTVGGVDVRSRVRVAGATIRDVLNDAPNTAAFTMEGTPPTVDQVVRITVNSDAPRLLFDGVIESVAVTYQGRPTNLAYQVRAIDDTPRANARLPFGAWTDLSATSVAVGLVASYTTGFTATHVALGLPPVSINLDGSEGMNGAMRQIAKLIGGYFYWEDFDLHLFQTAEPGDVPDPLDDTPGRFLDDPPITHTLDTSQMRTRVYGIGHGESTLSAVNAGDTVIPIADVSMFNTAGGRAITETQQLAYTGTQKGGGGGLVGPGAAPAGAPVVALVANGVIEVGAHQYAVSFVTASGESLPGPRAAVTLGSQTSAPVAPPITTVATTLVAGGAVETGVHQYAVTFVAGNGETTPGPSVTVTTGPYTGAPINPPSNPPSLGTAVPGSGIQSNNTYSWATTFVTATGETTPSPIASRSTPPQTAAPPASAPSLAQVAGSAGWINGDTVTIGVVFDSASSGSTTIGPVTSLTFTIAGNQLNLSGIPLGPADTNRRTFYYHYQSNSPNNVWRCQIVDNVSTTFVNFPPPGSGPSTVLDNSAGRMGPTSNTFQITKFNVPVSLPTGPAAVTARRLYRTTATDSTLRRTAQINDNTTPNYTDSLSDASLASQPAAPTSNTTGVTTNLNEVDLAGIPIGPTTGPTPVVARRIYRTAANQSQLKLLGTLFENTSTIWYDIVADSALGANAPTSNTTPITTTYRQTSLTQIPIGNAAVTSRKVYRTAADLTQLKLLQTIGDNTTTTAADNTPDASLGANAPTSDASGLQQPAGQVTAGSPTMIVAGTGAFSPSGGWAVIGNGQQVIRYTGVNATSLVGIPASGVGAITATVSYNSTITAAPALVGVTGIARALLSGAPINLWIQRDDLGAQAELAARASTPAKPFDGIIEHRISDERRGEASLRALCDADLEIYSRPIDTVRYASRDVKTKSGKPITIDLDSPPMALTLTIQDVTIDQLDLSPGLPPRFTVTASSVRFSLEDLLRRMAATLEGT